MTQVRQSGVWFERVYSRAGLPFWAGVLIVGTVPAVVLLPVSYYAAGLWQDFIGGGAGFAPYLFVILVYLQYGVKYMRRRLEGTTDYADSLVADGSRSDLRNLYGLRGILLTLAILMTPIQGSYVAFGLPPGYSLAQKLVVSVPFFYWSLFIGTFFWVFLYSMYRVYSVGKLPLQLRPFTEDRTLGLKPFGRISLQLTALYLFLIAMIVIPQTFLLGTQALIIALGTIMMLLGVAVFFLPLLSLHGKLVAARQRELAWVSPRLTELVQMLKQGGSDGSDEKVIMELTGLDNVQRDIHQIHSWPFDVGIITRLAAIVFSMIAILLANYARIILRF